LGDNGPGASPLSGRTLSYWEERNLRARLTKFPKLFSGQYQFKQGYLILLFQEDVVVRSDLGSSGEDQERVTCRTQISYTIRPGEHGIRSFRTCGEKVVPPYGSRNSGLFSGRPKHTAIFTLGELSTLIIKVFYSQFVRPEIRSKIFALTCSRDVVECRPISAVRELHSGEVYSVEIYIIFAHELV
jgi:hypothetical protein